jgi:aldose 1-epimerase
MDFAVESERFQGVELLRLRAPGGTTAVVVPGWGGNCVAFGTADGPVLEAASLDEVARKPTAYGIPILFPFPNRIRDGRFTFEGREHRIDPPRHGLVRDKPWTIVASGAGEADAAWLKMRLDAIDHPREILGQFPFPFRIEATVRLREGALELDTVARNTGEQTMPVGFGVHPYFHAAQGAAVSVPANERWELADSLPTGRTVPVEGRYDLRKPRPIDGLALDDVYTSVAADVDGRARCVIADPTRGLHTVIEFDPCSLPEVVVYNPPAPRRAICVEPQSCPTDAFNLASRGIDSHMLRLAPREEARWTIHLSQKKGSGVIF